MNDMSFFLIFLSYLSGSVPYGLILTRLAGGLDLRRIGSGNIGMTNVLRTGRKDVAMATLILDAFKGTIPVAISLSLVSDPLTPLLVAVAAVMGHVFPVWLKFKGGKGVATALGVYLALDWQLALLILATWGVVARWSKTSSLAALISFMLSPLYAYLVAPNLLYFSGFVTLFILFTHRENIQRLIRGQEDKVF